MSSCAAAVRGIFTVACDPQDSEYQVAYREWLNRPEAKGKDGGGTRVYPSAGTHTIVATAMMFWLLRHADTYLLLLREWLQTTD